MSKKINLFCVMNVVVCLFAIIPAKALENQNVVGSATDSDDCINASGANIQTLKKCYAQKDKIDEKILKLSLKVPSDITDVLESCPSTCPGKWITSNWYDAAYIHCSARGRRLPTALELAVLYHPQGVALSSYYNVPTTDKRVQEEIKKMKERGFETVLMRPNRNQNFTIYFYYNSKGYSNHSALGNPFKLWSSTDYFGSQSALVYLFNVGTGEFLTDDPSYGSAVGAIRCVKSL